MVHNSRWILSRTIKIIISYSIAFLPALVYTLLRQQPNYVGGTFTDISVVFITIVLLYGRYKNENWN